MSNLLGKWVKPDNEGNFEIIDIIEISDGLARGIGKNIPVDDLIAKYKRPDTLVADPFASDLGLDPSALGIEDVTMIIPNNEIVVVSNIMASNDSISSVLEPRRDVTTESASPAHDLIRSAIKLSNSSSSLSFPVTIDLPFDIESIKNVARTLGIDVTIVADVIMSNIERNPEKILASVKDAIANKLFEVDCMPN